MSISIIFDFLYLLISGIGLGIPIIFILLNKNKTFNCKIAFVLTIITTIMVISVSTLATIFIIYGNKLYYFLSLLVEIIAQIIYMFLALKIMSSKKISNKEIGKLGVCILIQILSIVLSKYFQFKAMYMKVEFILIIGNIISGLIQMSPFIIALFIMMNMSKNIENVKNGKYNWLNYVRYIYIFYVIVYVVVNIGKFIIPIFWGLNNYIVFDIISIISFVNSIIFYVVHASLILIALNYNQIENK